MFYEKGIDITNDKQMFNFLKDHYTYYTMNSWNGLSSIANNVKVHNLSLDGNCYTALAFLQDDDYFTINMMIEDWEREHKGYKVGFNGRSGGYLVLYNDHNNRSALPDEIDECEDYEEYKRWCKDFCGSVKENRRDLVETVRLVQDFDKLCDELRDYVNELSTRDFVSETFEKVVNQFNEDYYSDLEQLGFGELIIEDEKVFIGEIRQMTSLYEAFCRLANRRDFGLRLKEVEPDYVMLVEE
jgi:hypothetical protein